MQTVVRGLSVVIALAIVSPIIVGIRMALGRGAQGAAHYALNLRDAKTSARAVPAEPDFPYVYRVVQSAPTVEDSTIACALYRTPDDKFGLLAPALVARRHTADSVSIEYDDDVHKRCVPLAESRGFPITLKETPRLLQWGIEPGRRRIPRGFGLRA
jgi:hypothetical protein